MTWSLLHAWWLKFILCSAGSLTGTASRAETTTSSLLAGFSAESRHCCLCIVLFWKNKPCHKRTRVYMNEKKKHMGNVEINTINILLTLYKMMCNTNGLLAAGWFEPGPAWRRQGECLSIAQYRLKTEQKMHKTFRDEVLFSVYPHVSRRSRGLQAE